jgi:hypothetical protein
MRPNNIFVKLQKKHQRNIVEKKHQDSTYKVEIKKMLIGRSWPYHMNFQSCREKAFNLMAIAQSPQPSPSRLQPLDCTSTSKVVTYDGTISHSD